ncbi:alpha/beta fold hydrolase [Massilia glaciei]|uniref:alpha/beta fold hydrolase n=1 Tax=Massilia glaciei TaxID=1524097 RepID=UPI001E2BD2BB|nr:alpha/beta hydrolase [Massilia glaciei]
MINRICIAASLGLALAAPPSDAAPVSEQGKSCHLSGSEETLRCISVPVPLDYGKAGGEQLKLHVTVAPAFRESARPDPLFVLAGGPGQAGSDVLPLLPALRKVRATRDIVFIDQRGTGLSGKLDCETKPGYEALTEAELDSEARLCIAKIGKSFAPYGTDSAARDIEQVRRALGYGQINLWGGSYGTRLAQHYARAFPSSVRSMILDGVAAPDQIVPAGGRDAQAALDTLFDQCRAEPACNKAFPALRAEFAALAERVATDKLVLELSDPRTAAPLRLAMTRERFQSTVHNILYSPLDSRRLPFLIHSAYLGRWAPFVARRNVASDFSADGAVAIVLHLAVVCAEDVPRLTPELVAENARQTFMSAPALARLAGLCPAVKVPAAPYRAPATIAAPILMLSGALDPVTPPRRAEAAGRHMARAQHLVVANAGHGVSHLGCGPRLMREFLDQPQGKVDGACLKEIPAPSFQLNSAGPQP